MSTHDDPRPDEVHPDEVHPDEALPDSAMASGSDAGGAGEHLGPGELSPDERRLLEALEQGAGSGPRDGAADLAAVRAAEDEGPLPAHGGSQDDGLDAVFRPGEA